MISLAWVVPAVAAQRHETFRYRNLTGAEDIIE